MRPLLCITSADVFCANGKAPLIAFGCGVCMPCGKNSGDILEGNGDFAMIYTVTMNPSLDYIMYFDALETGALNRSHQEAHLAGGKGINVARVLHHLQLPVTCLGFTAGYVGEQLGRMLETEGVRTDFTRLPEGCTRINVKAKTIQNGETELNGSGPVITPKALEELKGIILGLTENDILVLSGSVPSGVSKMIYRELGTAAVERGAGLIIDAEKELLYPALSCRPILVKPNLEELETMLGRKPTSPEQIREGMSELREKGARNVLLSMGAAGAYFLSEDCEFFRLEAPKGKAVNTVGAGDSMVAGFLSRYGRAGLAECAVYAAACGSACAFQEDLPGQREADALLPDVVCSFIP